MKDKNVDTDREERSENRSIPRQMIRIRRTKVDDDYIKVELRYVSYQKTDKTDDTDEDVTAKVLSHLFSKYQEMSAKQKKRFIEQQPQHTQTTILQMAKYDDLNQ
ncbi:unnamed protein product [Bursaphelenchus okinawaensis]|uniref:Uncharacterized protein n=1 Tax=Bursaphelenchus okinawaensis TaxID=465554 RepID=A0A811JSB8_9BILA|nr:unnamed protein product [Bursaphelenchus okinawaensis]CAG9080920.1 unnamed protein product [Bursaphelenchus okinawaensis]